MIGRCSTSSTIEPSLSNITLVAHADWSKNPAKRWIALAKLQPDRHWELFAPYNIQKPSLLFSQLKSRKILPGSLLIGFDFPIGLPHRYAIRTGLTDFLSALSQFGHEEWLQFFSPAETQLDISLYRPFYPSKPGNSSRTALENSLEISFSDLYRLCEKRQVNRRAACPLFWTLGSQQVGKAAISGWQDLIIPALVDPEQPLKIWPFSGTLAECSLADNLIIAETYPAEYYHHLELSFSSPTRKSKRRQTDRMSFSNHLISWAVSNNLELNSSLVAALMHGFGGAIDGEDRFDAVIGLYGMINIVMGNRTLYEPVDPVIRQLEGWIFGQDGSKGEVIAEYITE